MKIEDLAALAGKGSESIVASPEVFQQIGALTRLLHDTMQQLGVMPKLQDAAEGLPDAPGVYVFRDDQGRALYVGKSQRIRSRVRTYFTASETRSRIGEMVGIAESVTGIECATPLEAEIRAREPAFRVQGLPGQRLSTIHPGLQAVRGSDEAGELVLELRRRLTEFRRRRQAARGARPEDGPAAPAGTSG